MVVEEEERRELGMIRIQTRRAMKGTGEEGRRRRTGFSRQKETREMEPRRDGNDSRSSQVSSQTILLRSAPPPSSSWPLHSLSPERQWTVQQHRSWTLPRRLSSSSVVAGFPSRRRRTPLSHHLGGWRSRSSEAGDYSLRIR